MISDDVKFWIFYGAMLLWMLWGIVNYFFDYASQIYLGLMIWGLMIWIGVVAYRRVNIVMNGGSVRIMNHRIP